MTAHVTVDQINILTGFWIEIVTFIGLCWNMLFYFNCLCKFCTFFSFLEKKSFNFFKDQQPDNQMSVSEKHMTDTEKMVYDQVSAEYY